MKKLYIDFDGVIMNTNNAITNLLDEHQVDRTNYDETVNFLKKINWDKLLKECDEISNAFSHLKTLNDSNDFNVAILTHVCSEEEANEKKKLQVREVFADVQESAGHLAKSIDELITWLSIFLSISLSILTIT